MCAKSRTFTNLPSNFSSIMLQRASLLLVASATVFLTAEAQDARVVTRIVSDTVPAWKTWKSDAGTLNYPGAWSVITESGGDTLAVFIKQAPSGASALPKVSLVVGPKASDAPSNQPTGTNVRIISSTSPDADGAFSVEYTVEAGNGTVLHHRKEVKVSGDRTYTLVYSAPEPAFEESLYLAEAMMKSFSPAAGGK